MKDIKVTIQFEDYVIPDVVIVMPCVPAVGSWITFPPEWLRRDDESPVDCNEFRVTYVDYNIDVKGEVSRIYASVCINNMFNK